MNKKIFILLGFVVFISSLLGAIPYTSLGNINIPNAYVLPNKMVDIGYVNLMATSGETVEYDGYDYAAYLQFGLLDKAEVGLVYTSNVGVFGNLKIRVINETEQLPALAIGVTNLFSTVEDFESGDSEEEVLNPDDYIQNSPYIAVSKSIVLITGIPGLNYLETSFHGGLGTRKYSGKGDIVKNFSGIFWGVEVKPSNYFGFDFEFDSRNINFGANAYFQNFALRLGMYELEDYLGIKGEDSDIIFAANINYTLDKFSDIKATDRKKKMDVPQKISKARPSKQVYEEEANPLRDELEQIRKRRKQAEKELEEIRKLLQD